MAKSTPAAAAVAQHITDATVVAEETSETPAPADAVPEAPTGEQWRDKHYTSRVLVISDTRTARVVAGHVSVEQGDEELQAFLQKHADFERVED